MALCTICEKAEVYSQNETTDHCVLCFMTGRYFEKVLESDERSNLLTRIREIPNVRLADVWHGFQAMFTFGMLLADGRMVVCGTIMDDIVVPAIPPVGMPWGVQIVRPIEGDNEWAGATPTTMPGEYDDEQLVELIQEIA